MLDTQICHRQLKKKLPLPRFSQGKGSMLDSAMLGLGSSNHTGRRSTVR